MRFGKALGGAVVAGLLAAGPAAGFMIVPADEGDRIFVVIEKAYGDLVPFRWLPEPFGDFLQAAEEGDRLAFRWRHYRSRDEGRSFLRVDAGGRGEIRFEFTGRDTIAGDTLAAAAVLTDADGTALHTFFAKARMLEAAGAGEERHDVRLSVERAPEWWDGVGGIMFFYMKYRDSRELAESEIWAAMRRAVWRVTDGEGTEQMGAEAD